ncbi:DUF4236 domain-containing protein [Halomonas sp. BC04]
MALRFRRRIRIAPGISLNLSKSGIGGQPAPRQRPAACRR